MTNNTIATKNAVLSINHTRSLLAGIVDAANATHSSRALAPLIAAAEAWHAAAQDQLDAATAGAAADPARWNAVCDAERAACAAYHTAVDAMRRGL